MVDPMAQTGQDTTRTDGHERVAKHDARGDARKQRRGCAVCRGRVDVQHLEHGNKVIVSKSTGARARQLRWEP